MFRQTFITAALAASVSFPSIAFADDPVPLTEDVVAASAAKDCGYKFSIVSVIETLYGKDASTDYANNHDLTPAKYADKVAAVNQWMLEHLDAVAPLGKTYEFWTYVQVRPSHDHPGQLEAPNPSFVTTGFPRDYCREFHARDFSRGLGQIGVCSATYPGAYLFSQPVLKFPQSVAAGVTFAFPDGVDPSATMGGAVGDRSAIAQIDGEFVGCDKGQGGGQAWFWPTTIRLYGVKHGAFGATYGWQWFAYDRAAPHSRLIGEKQSKAYQDMASTQLATFTFPAPNIAPRR